MAGIGGSVGVGECGWVGVCGGPRSSSSSSSSECACPSPAASCPLLPKGPGPSVNPKPQSTEGEARERPVLQKPQCGRSINLMTTRLLLLLLPLAACSSAGRDHPQLAKRPPRLHPPSKAPPPPAAPPPIPDVSDGYLPRGLANESIDWLARPWAWPQACATSKRGGRQCFD